VTAQPLRSRCTTTEQPLRNFFVIVFLLLRKCRKIATNTVRNICILLHKRFESSSQAHWNAIASKSLQIAMQSLYNRFAKSLKSLHRRSATTCYTSFEIVSEELHNCCEVAGQSFYNRCDVVLHRKCVRFTNTSTHIKQGNRQITAFSYYLLSFLIDLTE
jgi:hypothetical protein